MKRYFFWLAILCLPALAEKSNDSDRWHAKMKSLSRLIPGLMEDLDAPPSLYSEQTRERIQTKADELAKLTHEIKIETQKKGTSFGPASDPGVGFLAGYLEKDAKLASNAIREGHWEYGRRVLKSITSYCVACHVRNSSGVEYPSFDFGIDDKRLSPMERAELAAATRQFDRAFTEFRAIVMDPKFAHSQQLEWWRAMKFALGLGVRYQRDPKAVSEMVETVQKFKTPAILATRYLSAWQESLKTWAQEKSNPSTLQEARRLLLKAEKLQEYPADHSADIEFLRLTAVTHDLLAKGGGAAEVAEALYLSGIAYEALDFPDLWTLQDHYYQRCIELTPHTKLSRNCYRRLEDSLIAGFTGSAGTSLPREVQDRLTKLKALSTPK